MSWLLFLVCILKFHLRIINPFQYNLILPVQFHFFSVHTKLQSHWNGQLSDYAIHFVTPGRYFFIRSLFSFSACWKFFISESWNATRLGQSKMPFRVLWVKSAFWTQVHTGHTTMKALVLGCNDIFHLIYEILQWAHLCILGSCPDPGTV